MTKSLTCSEFNKNCHWFYCKECGKYQRWAYKRGTDLVYCKECRTLYTVDNDVKLSRIELAGKRVSYEDQFKYFAYMIGNEYFDVRQVCTLLNVSLSYGYKIVDRWLDDNKITKTLRRELTHNNYRDSHGYLFKIRRDNDE